MKLVFILMLVLFVNSFSTKITSGSYTIGTGGDYATIKEFADSIGTQTGSITGTIISQITETATAVFDNVRSTYGITLTAQNPWRGDPNDTTYMITYNVNSAYGIRSLFTTSGTLTIKEILFKDINKVFLFRQDATQGVLYIVRCGLNGNNRDGQFYTTTTATLSFVIGNIAWNVASFVYTGNTYFQSTIENNTLYNFNIYGIDLNNINSIVKNNLVLSLDPSKPCFRNTGSATGYNNASTDTTTKDSRWTTASDNLYNVNTANEFYSTDTTNINFLKIKPGGTLYNSGYETLHAIDTIGIRGNHRIYKSIGADEYYPDTFYLSYTVTEGNISITFESDSIAAFGESVNFSVVVQAGDVGFFDNGSFLTGSNDFSVVMLKDSSLSLNSHIIPTVIIDTTWGDSIAAWVITEGLSVDSGSTVHTVLSVTPGSRFVGYTGDFESTEAITQFNPTANWSITATGEAAPPSSLTEFKCMFGCRKWNKLERY